MSTYAIASRAHANDGVVVWWATDSASKSLPLVLFLVCSFTDGSRLQAHTHLGHLMSDAVLNHGAAIFD